MNQEISEMTLNEYIRHTWPNMAEEELMQPGVMIPCRETWKAHGGRDDLNQ